MCRYSCGQTSLVDFKLHGSSLALIQVENAYDGVIREKAGVFWPAKRKGDGVGLQSVRHIAENLAE